MIFIDVRTEEEYNNGHKENALHFDIMRMMDGFLPDINKDTEIVLYCESGNRSMMAKSIMEKNGFSNVIDGGAFNKII